MIIKEGAYDLNGGTIGEAGTIVKGRKIIEGENITYMICRIIICAIINSRHIYLLYV